MQTMKLLNLCGPIYLKLFPWYFQFLVGQRGYNLITYPIRKLLPISYNHSWLSKVFELMYLLGLLKAHLLIMNILPKKLRHLILLLRFHRSKGFTRVLKILALQLKLVRFHKVLEHIKLLFFWHKDLNL